MDDNTKKSEPRGNDRWSAESEYSIEHPLIGNQSLILANAGAMELFVESVRCLQDGDGIKASTLYQEALNVDPTLHTHARDALSNMIQSSSPETEGAVYYWLGIHSQYLEDNRQAAMWYMKAIDTFHKVGYQKREARAHCNLGRIKIQLGDPSGMEEFEKAITLNPNDGIAHIDIGMAYYITDDYERALDAFANAVFSDPSRYGPVVISRLQSFGYSWKEDVEKIGQRIAKKQGMDLDILTVSEREEILRAAYYYEIGNSFFQSARYKEALGQFEKGKLLSSKFPGNFFGACMTSMQMIEVGAISKDQIPFYLEKADQNIDECLRIAPMHLNYLEAKNIIRDYKRKYHV